MVLLLSDVERFFISFLKWNSFVSGKLFELFILDSGHFSYLHSLQNSVTVSILLFMV